MLSSRKSCVSLSAVSRPRTRSSKSALTPFGSPSFQSFASPSSSSRSAGGLELDRDRASDGEEDGFLARAALSLLPDGGEVALRVADVGQDGPELLLEPTAHHAACSGILRLYAEPKAGAIAAELSKANPMFDARPPGFLYRYRGARLSFDGSAKDRQQSLAKQFAKHFGSSLSASELNEADRTLRDPDARTDILAGFQVSVVLTLEAKDALAGSFPVFLKDGRLNCDSANVQRYFVHLEVTTLHPHTNEEIPFRITLPAHFVLYMIMASDEVKKELGLQ